MTDTIRILPGQATTSLTLRRTTALAACTSVDTDVHGHLVFVRNWPSLSDGEELLFSILGYLNGVDSLPPRSSLVAGIDAANLAAVDAVLAAEGAA